ncbi:SCO6745 family protein [Nocardiopsis potens]|uniref:SCO6745 family protein n=1 Tax=Nocardiopsis potens TaxID=1246458 RepID=UPI0003493D65|nr:hypothetical protein [Nocardiopsis potens]
MPEKSGGAVSAELARTAWSVLEPLHALVYFTPEAEPGYAEIGLETGNGAAYFASRSAPMGAVGPGPVAAAFYNFNPELVASVLPEVWGTAPPEKVVRARFGIADRALAAALGPDLLGSPGLAEAAELARTAVLGAAGHRHGRPLYAGHADLDWPEGGAHLALWHAATLIREFRGDGHVALLAQAGIGPVEALVTHVAAGPYKAPVLRKTRWWSERDWAGAVDRLADRGLVAPGGDPESPVFTDAGRELREELERRTDELSVPAFTALGAEATARLAELAAPLRDAVLAAGVLPGTRKR